MPTNNSNVVPLPFGRHATCVLERCATRNNSSLFSGFRLSISDVYLTSCVIVFGQSLHLYHSNNTAVTIASMHWYLWRATVLLFSDLVQLLQQWNSERQLHTKPLKTQEPHLTTTSTRTHSAQLTRFS